MFPPPTGTLRPSAAPRWGGPCVGSFALEALFPEDDGPEAREGTAAHFYVTEYLQGRAWPVGAVTPNGVPLDADMIELGQAYIDDVRDTVATMGPQAQIRVETRVFPTALIHHDCDGTPDTWAIDYDARRLVLWDYKYGHRNVEVFGNLQFIAYLAGIFEGYEINPDEMHDNWTIEVRVVQPRSYHRDGIIRSWKVDVPDLAERIDALSKAAHLAKLPGAPVTTGPHCRDCAAIHACPAAIAQGLHLMEYSSAPLPLTMTPDEIGLYLRFIAAAEKRLAAIKDGLTAQALHHVDRGVRIPYWGKGYVNSQERWSAPVEEVAGLGDMLGVELRKPGLVTPAAARKLVDPMVIAQYTVKPTGAAKLIPMDDTAAIKAFGKGPPKL